MSKFNYIIDNGHGGVIDGVYQTAPNYDNVDSKTWRKMWVHDGVPFYEGEFNRKVAKRLIEKLEDACIDHFELVPERDDIGLQKRVERVNSLCVKHDKRNIPYILFSIIVIKFTHISLFFSSKNGYNLYF